MLRRHGSSVRAEAVHMYTPHSATACLIRDSQPATGRQLCQSRHLLQASKQASKQADKPAGPAHTAEWLAGGGLEQARQSSPQSIILLVRKRDSNTRQVSAEEGLTWAPAPSRKASNSAPFLHLMFWTLKPGLPSTHSSASLALVGSSARMGARSLDSQGNPAGWLWSGAWV